MLHWKKLAVAGLAVLAIAVPALAAPADASAALTLSQRVAKVEAKLACLQWTGISEYDGFAPYAGGDGLYAYDPYTSWTGASLDDANDGGYQDFRLAVIKPTSTCRAKFTHAANPYVGWLAGDSGDAAARSSSTQSKVEKSHLG
jgi:hypothetical protein